MNETIKALEQARAAITAAHIVGGQQACDDAVAVIDLALAREAQRQACADEEWVQVMHAIQQQFKRFGNCMPDGFDSRVFRWVDDLMAGRHVQLAEPLTLESAPLGTKAPAIGGGHWTKVERGWKWATGATFPRPGGDWTGELLVPEQSGEMGAKVVAGAAINGRLYRALQALLRRDEQNTCQHQETHRGGAIWTICDDCGAKWADDEGGKPDWSDPTEWIEARDALAEAEGAGGAALGAGEPDVPLLRMLADLPCDALGRAQEAARMRLERLQATVGV